MVWNLVQRKRVDRFILSLALVARVAVFILATRGFFIVGEGQVQADLAGNILSGRGFMLSQSMFHADDPERDASLQFFRDTGGFYGALLPEKPTSFLVPGYALFEAFIFMVTSPGNLLAVIAVQLLLGLLTVFMGMRLASVFLKGRWYIAAGILMALDPFELYYQAIPATQALFSLLFIAGLLMSVRLIQSPGRIRALLTGLVWAAAFMVRPAALPMTLWLAAVVLVSGKFKARSLISAGLLVLVFFAALVPWMVRNRSTMGRYQLLPLQGGVQMWEFNGRIFTDAFQDEQQGAKLLYGPVRRNWIDRLNMPELAEFPDFTDETEFQRDSILNHRQLTFLRANPGVFLHLSSCRFVEFIKPFPLNYYSKVHAAAGFLFFFWVGLFFAGGTLLLLYRKGAGVFLAGVIAGYILMHLLTASGTPHRVGLDIPLFIAALIGLRHSLLRVTAAKTAP